MLVQSNLEKRAALRLMRKLLKKRGMAPEVLVTDRASAHWTAAREHSLSANHIRNNRKNKRAESSHVPIRRRECKIQGFHADVDRTERAGLSFFDLCQCAASKIRSLEEGGRQAMNSWTIQHAIRWMKSEIRRLRSGVLAEPLSCGSDREIDAALERSAITRADLFCASNAIARHRIRLAYMLAAWRIDARRATEDHWEELKVADNRCSLCPNTGRCERWLEWGRFNAAPLTFCPNAPLFLSIAAEQAPDPRG